tara:strand:+ start:99 stop:626 length:528 start_codon:yes stop_codon:yes gene_type:complete
MKNLILILCLSSLCLAQLLPSDKELASMSPFEKQMLYEKNKKNKLIALSYQYLIPTLGYAHINQWNRGLKFLGAEILFLTMGFSMAANNGAYWEEENYDDTYYCNNSCKVKSFLGLTSIIASGALKIYEFVDLSKQTNKYNERLHNKIFGKKDNNFSFLILPTSDGAYLNLSYKF